MSNSKRSKFIAASVVMALCLCSCFMVFGNDDSEAASDATYGTISEFNLAPGFKWTYTPTYPSDLSVTTTILKQGTNTSSGTSSSIVSGTWASISGNIVTVQVPSGAAVGSVYDVILKATTSTGGITQTAYQYLRVNVTAGITASGTASDVVLGNAASVTLTASSSMGTVSWAVTSGKSLPAGLTLSGSSITGTPTSVGSNTIHLTASAKGQSTDIAIPFTVYNVIQGGSAQTLMSYGTTVTSSTVSQTGSDLGVTWAVTSGTLPSGFTLNSSTGVIAGSSTVKQSVTLTLTGTSANGPTQTATKQVTIQSEPKLTTISGDSAILTYTGNSNVTETYTSAVSGTSTLTWSLVGAPTGVTINSSTGVVTVTGSAAVTTGTTFTVKAASQYGQSITKDVTLTVSGTLDVTGSTSVSTTAGTAVTSTYTATGGNGNTFSIVNSNAPSGANVSINASTGVLSLSGASPAGSFTVDVKVTSADGQTDTITVTCQIMSVLVYTSTPSNGVIAYAI